MKTMSRFDALYLGSYQCHSWFSVSFEYGNKNGTDSRPSSQKRWAEANDAIAYIDYTDSKDAPTDSIFCLWKERTAHLLPSSVCDPSISFSSRIDFFFHIFLFQIFVVDRLLEMSRWQKCQLSNHMFIRQVESPSKNQHFLDQGSF